MVIVNTIIIFTIINLDRSTGKIFRKMMLQRCITDSKGVTLCLQRVMNVLFLFTNYGKTCESSMVDEAINYLLNMLSDNFETQMSQMSERQRNVFRAIAKEGVAKGVLSGDFINKYQLISSSSVSSALKALLDKDLITQEKGSYMVYDHFFALWLKKINAKDSYEDITLHHNPFFRLLSVQDNYTFQKGHHVQVYNNTF